MVRPATRRRGGRAVLDHPNVQKTVGEIWVAVESSRAMLHRALCEIRTVTLPVGARGVIVARPHRVARGGRAPPGGTACSPVSVELPRVVGAEHLDQVGAGGDAA
ncbi:hypothetical protein [Sinosporangium siamense]|uniref:Uncharacterized protein n=1 Tax=Sinosporangium siamense TaxID=1367973 RepID=A0A919VAU4_9ACTN|nr:hypothetical protein Ssi02_69990 [Sinosporangium siamense]